MSDAPAFDIRQPKTCIEMPHGNYMREVRKIDPLWGVSSENPAAWARILKYLAAGGRIRLVEDTAYAILYSWDNMISPHDLADEICSNLSIR